MDKSINFYQPDGQGRPVATISKNMPVVAGAAAVLLVAIAWLLWAIYLPVRLANPVTLDVKEGSVLKEVASELARNGLIKNELIFIVYVSARGEEKEIKAGKYLFSGNLNMPEVASILVGGMSLLNDMKITIPEGYNVWEIDKLLTQKNLIEAGDFSSRFYGDEGYLFPDTYRIRGEIANKGRKDDFMTELREKMSKALETRIREIQNFILNAALFDSNIDRAVIIASMLEKEAKTEEDMRLIAGIINRRIAMDMPLQIDASVIYGACLREFIESAYSENCDVTFQGPAREINIDSPYNTYIRKGLPAGPISNPGLVAMRAALNPQTSEYLYYLSTRDGGEIIFSKTSAEHLKNRKKYLGF